MKPVYFLNQPCQVDKMTYSNGRTALRLSYVTEDGNLEPMATATVNMPCVPLLDDYVLIKDYSENEGMLDALVSAGVVRDTGERIDIGFVTVPVCKVLI